MTDESLEMNHVHFLVAPPIEKSRDFSAHVVYRVSHFNCPPQIFRKLHILEEKVLDKSCRVSRGASNSDLDHDRYHGRQGHFKVKSKFSNGTPLFSHRNWKEEEILRPNMTLTVTSMSRSCQNEIQTS